MADGAGAHGCRLRILFDLIRDDLAFVSRGPLLAEDHLVDVVRLRITEVGQQVLARPPRRGRPSPGASPGSAAKPCRRCAQRQQARSRSAGPRRETSGPCRGHQDTTTSPLTTTSGFTTTGTTGSMTWARRPRAWGSWGLPASPPRPPQGSIQSSGKVPWPLASWRSPTLYRSRKLSCR
jgi:hypothetical protein